MDADGVRGGVAG